MPPAVEAWSLNHWTPGEVLLVLLKKKIFFLVVLGLCCCMPAFSSCGSWGLIFSCGAWTSYCGGFSCCRARVLGVQASEAAAPWPSSCSLQAVGLEGFSSCGAWIP